MAFKLGKRSTRPNTPMEKPMVFRKKMNDGSLAQANNDGSIDIDSSVDPNSKLAGKIMRHEMVHLQQMEDGRADYGEGWVMWEDKIYIRGEEGGVNYIDGPNGRWPEGHPNHPWEAEAIAAEKIKNNKK